MKFDYLQLFVMPWACFQYLRYRSLLLYSLLLGTLGANKRKILENTGNIFPNLGTYSDVFVALITQILKKKNCLGF